MTLALACILATAQTTWTARRGARCAGSQQTTATRCQSTARPARARVARARSRSCRRTSQRRSPGRSGRWRRHICSSRDATRCVRETPVLERVPLLNHCCSSITQWGVGNWKSILNDPEFKFDGRSPVDLKDRYAFSFINVQTYAMLRMPCPSVGNWDQNPPLCLTADIAEIAASNRDRRNAASTLDFVRFECIPCIACYLDARGCNVTLDPIRRYPSARCSDFLSGLHHVPTLRAKLVLATP